ncbi:MAG: TetR family transcriptional regulator C-terminal domain-containing protein [Actinomycetota bacterium]|nr:TetR family transcriptional regulator C-terminal domain-containing protein [Actinomycetota bacterium]
MRDRAARRGADGEQWALLSAEFWLHALRNRELVPKLAARQQAGRAALARVIEGVSAQLGFPLPAGGHDFASVMLAVDDGLVLQEALDPKAVPDDLRVRTLILFVQAMAAAAGPPPSGVAGPAAHP